MSVRTLALADFFKIGPGPSSSHTIAPLLAGRNFIQSLRTLPGHTLAKATQVEVRLFGSLSATGKEQNTGRAVLAGLLEHAPESVDPVSLRGLLRTPDEEHVLDLGAVQVPISADDILSDALKHRYPFFNALVITLRGREQKKLFEREYYSVGAGAIQWKGHKSAARAVLPLPFENCTELREQLRSADMSLEQAMLANEQAVTGHTPEQTGLLLDSLIQVMLDSVRRGLRTEGTLPGSLGLQRKASTLYARTQRALPGEGRLFLLLSACAFAAAEDIAAGERGVTAPGLGAGGILPAVLYLLREHFRYSRETLHKGLLAAAAIGFAVNNNPSIAGADVGCQGEIGLAAAMAAAMLAYTWEHSFEMAEHAAAIALRHHLGMTCDPEGGLVQAPCIERNAMGAVKAYNAALIATADCGAPVRLDAMVEALAVHSREMNETYKRSVKGGLPLAMPLC